ncbi:hypothetical protein SCHPADRAFT_487772 [Schizopora paradoxa]|uniref:Uncharacterized protein n=1 Tax=Schizopora paradoxa TaxID=27342 RepID=A0A0H2RGR9_9AGAM|nr:hypothetical protein SCHPADRAFT_487772 [Schizopora paradoxa]
MSPKVESKPAGRPNADEQSIGEHAEVESIEIVFNEGFEAHKELEVFIGAEKRSAKLVKVDLSSRTYRWEPKHGISVFPNDKLIIRPLHKRWRDCHFTLGRKDRIDSYEISGKDLMSLCDHDSGSPLDGPECFKASGRNSKVILRLFLRGFEALVDVDITSLDSSKVTETVMSLTSSESLQTAASEIQSVLGQIGANVAVVEDVIQTLENVASQKLRCPHS